MMKIFDWLIKRYLKRRVGKLSHREAQVLGCIMQGKSNKEIAYKLNVSYQTVKNHVSHIYLKLDVHSRTQLALLAMRNGWVR
jgi:DNA-binding NarL/FixJ family response regulator